MKAEIFKVGLFLSSNLLTENYEINLKNLKIQVFISNGIIEDGNFYNLIVSDKDPDKISNISKTHGEYTKSIFILNKISNSYLDRKYESIFGNIKLNYKSFELSESSIRDLINSEAVKHHVKNNQFTSTSLFINKYTRKELIKKFSGLFWLLIPLIIILSYFIIKHILNKFGVQVSFLCYFVEYEPDCNKNILEELKVFALFYSFFNLIFFYNYILTIYDNINNDIFQFNSLRSKIHKALQLVTPIILFISALIIFKSIFVSKYSFQIASENGFININSIFDKRLEILKDQYLVFYFLILDICLWLVTKNFLKVNSQIDNFFSSNRQTILISSAKKNFGISIILDSMVIVFTFVFFNIIIQDLQSKLAVQIIVLQVFYLYINISIIYYEFKYS